MLRFVLMMWIVVMILDNVLPIILAEFYNGFNYKEMALSLLGCNQSPVKLIYNCWCIFSGLVFCIAGYTVHFAFHNKLSIAIFVLLILYGFGCEVLSGFFPLNEKREDENTSTKIHGIGSVIGFTALLFVPLLLGITSFYNNLISLGILSVICFAIAFILFCFFVMGEKDKFKNTVLRFGGLWQRLVLLTCYLPLIYFSIHML